MGPWGAALRGSLGKACFHVGNELHPCTRCCLLPAGKTLEGASNSGEILCGGADFRAAQTPGLLWCWEGGTAPVSQGLVGCWRWSRFPMRVGNSTVPLGNPTTTKQCAQGCLRRVALPRPCNEAGALRTPPGLGNKRHLSLQVVEGKPTSVSSNILA